MRETGATPVLRTRRGVGDLIDRLSQEELHAPVLERQLSEAQATGLAAQLEFGEPPSGR